MAQNTNASNANAPAPTTKLQPSAKGNHNLPQPASVPGMLWLGWRRKGQHLAGVVATVGAAVTQAQVEAWGKAVATAAKAGKPAPAMPAPAPASFALVEMPANGTMAPVVQVLAQCDGYTAAQQAAGHYAALPCRTALGDALAAGMAPSAPAPQDCPAGPARWVAMGKAALAALAK